MSTSPGNPLSSFSCVRRNTALQSSFQDHCSWLRTNSIPPALMTGPLINCQMHHILSILEEVGSHCRKHMRWVQGYLRQVLRFSSVQVLKDWNFRSRLRRTHIGYYEYEDSEALFSYVAHKTRFTWFCLNMFEFCSDGRLEKGNRGSSSW